MEEGNMLNIELLTTLVLVLVILHALTHGIRDLRRLVSSSATAEKWYRRVLLVIVAVVWSPIYLAPAVYYILQLFQHGWT
jgi:hypothetical protein